MDKPIFRSHMNQTSKPAPVKPAQPNAARKVVSIPVHFVGSDTSRSTSAVKIQKIFRGFLVRKSVKQILSIQREVYDVEKRILGILDLIRSDAKERLRVNETLMGLLFKLDSVRGVGSGVRECRKAVIKKVIFLQEIIDGSDQKTIEIEDSDECLDQNPIVIEDSGKCADDSTYNSQGLGIGCIGNEPNLSENTAWNFRADKADSNQALEIVGSGEFDSNNNYTAKDLETDAMNEESEVVNEHNLSEKSAGNFDADLADQALEIETKTVGIGIECPNQGTEKDDDPKQELKRKSEADEDEEDYCIVKKVVGETEGEDDDTKLVAKQFAEDHSMETELNEEDKAKTTKGENLKDREIMERMIEENVKVMKELAEQNRAQTEMLSLLTRRVELLEKALVGEKLRKKLKDKKKTVARGALDDSDCCSDQKKGGKK